MAARGAIDFSPAISSLQGLTAVRQRNAEIERLKELERQREREAAQARKAAQNQGMASLFGTVAGGALALSPIGPGVAFLGPLMGAGSTLGRAVAGGPGPSTQEALQLGLGFSGASASTKAAEAAKAERATRSELLKSLIPQGAADSARIRVMKAAQESRTPLLTAAAGVQLIDSGAKDGFSKQAGAAVLAASREPERMFQNPDDTIREVAAENNFQTFSVNPDIVTKINARQVKVASAAFDKMVVGDPNLSMAGAETKLSAEGIPFDRVSSESRLKLLKRTADTNQTKFYSAVGNAANNPKLTPAEKFKKVEELKKQFSAGKQGNLITKEDMKYADKLLFDRTVESRARAGAIPASQKVFNLADIKDQATLTALRNTGRADILDAIAKSGGKITPELLGFVGEIDPELIEQELEFRLEAIGSKTSKSLPGVKASANEELKILRESKKARTTAFEQAQSALDRGVDEALVLETLRLEAAKQNFDASLFTRSR